MKYHFQDTGINPAKEREKITFGKAKWMTYCNMILCIHEIISFHLDKYQIMDYDEIFKEGKDMDEWKIYSDISFFFFFL